MALTTAQMVLLGRQGLNQVVHQHRKSNPVQVRNEFTRVINDKQIFLEMQQLGHFGMMAPTAELAPLNYDDMRVGGSKQWRAIKRTLGYAVSEEANYSDIYSQFTNQARMKKMMRAAALTEEKIAAAILDNQTNTAAPWQGLDGQPLLSATHTLQTGTFSNVISGALSPTTLADAVTRQLDTVNDRGDREPYDGPYTLLVPTSLMLYAEEIVKTDLKADTNENNMNVLRGRISKIVCVPLWETTTGWALLSGSEDERGLFVFEQLPLTSRAWYDENVFAYKQALMMSSVAGHCDWRGYVGSTGV